MKQFCLILFIAASALAQTTNATLSGTVTDPTGARVPNVQVTAQNVHTGVVLTNLTNEAGLYVFPSVQPGSYRLTAELPGFKTYVLNGITVNVAARMTINVPLELAAAQETVEVTAPIESPLAASTASVGGVINGRQIQELPLPDRDALGLVLTQAGLVGDNFAGNRISSLNVTRDGINVMDKRCGRQGVDEGLPTTERRGRTKSSVGKRRMDRSDDCARPFPRHRSVGSAMPLAG